MTSYTDYLEDTVWCNDRSVYSGNEYGTSGAYYSSYNRLQNNYAPSLACANENDRFTVSSDNGNGDLTYPIALLTEDEIAYAGGVLWAGNYTYYLHTGSWWWTLSPYSFDGSVAREWLVGYNGHCGTGYVNDGGGVRPAISLKPGTTYSSGNGSTSSPYVVN
jgi:hypothetical protein